jgi:hypothetical protein
MVILTLILNYQMSTMIRTFARQLNTRNPVMLRTLIRKYNTDTNVHLWSKFSDIDKGTLFANSIVVGGVVGAVAKPAKFYKDQREKGYQPDPALYVLEAMVGAAIGVCYFITIPAYLFTVNADRQFYKQQQEIREKLETDK